MYLAVTVIFAILLLIYYYKVDHFFDAEQLSNSLLSVKEHNFLFLILIYIIHLVLF